MSSPQSQLRQRGGKEKTGRPQTPKTNQNGVVDYLDKVHAQVSQKQESEVPFYIALGVLTVLAIATRFYKIGHPDEVVFDEVHFGKFASHYLQRSYFFDVHPPFGKLLFAFAGWFVGYGGEFLFENIGESYITNKVPYIAYRSMPALMGSFTVSATFLIMWESGYSLPACIVAACVVLFDNAQVGQTRLILLDAVLVFSMALSVLAYVKFYKLRHEPFSAKWWKWLMLTGMALSCVISTKYIGVFTFFSIGVPVAIDLWALLDVNRKQGALSLFEFGKHFAARVLGLIVVPFLIYLFWFQVHFTILNRSGPGDDFMTPEFQETLSDNMMTKQAIDIKYYDVVTIRHKETKMYLHSHTEKYPLRYEDGRISSQGQQVTGYPHNDTNNQWQIMPTIEISGNPYEEPVKGGDTVKFLHLGTNTVLMSHDVASPYYPTNQEITTTTVEEANGARYNETAWEIQMVSGKYGQQFKTMASHFKLIHKPSNVAMWTHTTPLPDWAFKQAEINGNKNVQASSNIWYIEELPKIPAEHKRKQKEEKKTKNMPFLKKWLELQRSMFHHNNALTSSHPYASFPISWPFLLRGVSFWTKADTREQIYFMGNPLGWWISSALLAVFIGILGADQLSLRRGVDALDERTRSRLYNSAGFFWITWAAHYVPFFLMGRQLFLHHYLPAHLASALVTGALVEFVFNMEPLDVSDKVVDAFKPSSSAVLTTDGSAKTMPGGTSAAPGGGSSVGAGKKRRATDADRKVPVRERMGNQDLLVTWAASAVIIALLVGSFIFFSPLTYGTPSLDVSQVLARKWLLFDLHFAK